MSTHPLGAPAIPKADQQSKHGTRARPSKTAITVLLSVAIFVGISVTTWSMLQAEFEKTFHGYSTCPVTTPGWADLART